MMLPNELGELTPEHFEYIGTDKVRVSLKTTAGDDVAYTLSVSMLLRSLTMSVDLINANKVAILKDANVF